MAAEYILAEGNPHVILCERGIRTFEPATRNTLDLSAVPVLKELTHLPVIVDPTHGTGKREPRAGDGAAPRSRPAPTGSSSRCTRTRRSALSDGAQSLTPAGLEALMPRVAAVAARGRAGGVASDGRGRAPSHDRHRRARPHGRLARPRGARRSTGRPDRRRRAARRRARAGARRRRGRRGARGAGRRRSAACDLAVLCTPVAAIEALLGPVSRLLADGAVLTDVGGAKERVVQLARAEVRAGRPLRRGAPDVRRPRRLRRRARRSLEGRRGRGLQRRRPPEAVERVADFHEALGAAAVRCTAAEHDAAVAMVSHLPYLLASALAAAATRPGRSRGGSPARA